MPTILSHPAVPLALGLGLGSDVISKRLLIAGALGSVLPDLDVVGFTFGIPYGHEFGHRGMSHSLVFAALVALAGATAKKILKTTFLRAFFFLFIATGSHGILDAFTNGGLGIALFWPWTGRRFFAPFQPIVVAPIGISDFLPYAAGVLFSELMWVWIPCLLAGAVLAAYRRRFQSERNRPLPWSRLQTEFVEPRPRKNASAEPSTQDTLKLFVSVPSLFQVHPRSTLSRVIRLRT